MKTFYDWLLTKLTPLIIWTSKVYMPFSRKKITGANYYLWRDSIKIGTVILTKTRGELSNLINPVEIKHAAIYVGDPYDEGVKYVMEATSKGVVLTDLVTFLTTKDLAVGCYPKFIRSKEKLTEELQACVNSYVGIPYDYLFNGDDKAFYCFELVADCFKSVHPELQLKGREIVKSKIVYDHNTFLDGDFFEVIFDSREEL